MSAIPAHLNPFAMTRFCAKCQDKMHQAVRDNGMWHRVTPALRDHNFSYPVTRAELNAVQVRLDRCDPYDPDPLMLVHALVMGKCRHTAALNDVSIAHHCPTCVFGADGWFGEAAAAVANRLEVLDHEKQEDIERSRLAEKDQRSL